MSVFPPTCVDDVLQGLDAHGYIADLGLATSVFLAIELQRPLLLEGEAGVGKTELAKTLARWSGGRLIRLQCYEGLDVSQAVYEWDYSRQLLHLRAQEAAGRLAGDLEAIEGDLYDRRFLVRRPLLEAIDHDDAVRPVLLLDELDRSDDEFEAFLLELLSEFSITIPEIGTLRAECPPLVVITSNRTRDVHDALKRRALYHWVDHPTMAREVEIIGRRTTGVSEGLALEVAQAVARFRDLGLYKPPGVAESIDWAQALHRLGHLELDVNAIEMSLGSVLKYREDQQRVREHGLGELIPRSPSR